MCAARAWLAATWPNGAADLSALGACLLCLLLGFHPRLCARGGAYLARARRAGEHAATAALTLSHALAIAPTVHSRTKLRKAVVGGRTALSDAMREVAIMKQLDCPQVLRLKEVIDDLREEKLYLVLEFADKGVAMDPVRVDNAIGEGEGARRIALDACLGTEYLHNRGVVHGDIKVRARQRGSDCSGCVQPIHETQPDRERSSRTTCCFLAAGMPSWRIWACRRPSRAPTTAWCARLARRPSSHPSAAAVGAIVAGRPTAGRLG